MIDTIVLRVHKLKEKYEYLVKSLEYLTEKDKAVIKYNTESIFKSDVGTYQYFADTSNIRFISVRNSVYNASSHYNLCYHANYERDYIEFNFSIPKFLYGTNVFQFTDHSEINIPHIWNKLENFLNKFLNQLFPMVPSYEDIEVNRLDMCLNQVFNSKDDALKFLSHQKTIKVKNARSERNRYSSYGSTAIQQVSQRYSFKVYHKGTEFKKNDYKELCKHNPKGYDLDKLRDFADRVLRYELTFRKGQFNYLYKQHIINDQNTMVNHNLMRLQSSKMKANREFIQNDLENKTFSFNLSSPFDDPKADYRTLTNCFSFTFDFDLFSKCYDFFIDRVNALQLSKKLSVNEIYEKLQEFSDKKKALKGRPIDLSTNVVIATLSQYVDLAELKGVIPKTTFYRYRNTLKDVGIPQYGIEDIHPPALDFAEYFFNLGKYHQEFN